MTNLVVLIIAVGLLVIVFFWSGRYGGRNRRSGTSLRRGPRAHTTSSGKPKLAYPTREAAETQARTLMLRDGVAMSVYRCDTCAKWHLGHVK